MANSKKLNERIAAGGAFEVRASAGAIGGELPPRPEAARQEASQLRSYIEDLEAVQRHCEQYVPIPDELTPAGRIALRMARLLIQGHCVASPFMTRARFTLNGQDSPTLRSLLVASPTPCGSVSSRSLSPSPEGTWSWARCTSITLTSPSTRKTAGGHWPRWRPGAARL
ncbi:hypothetical protein ACQI4E_31385 [Streptomyces sp. CA-252508]|uniref:hypothetical protein n=1 Tax=Streptomyces sp. CA-252508 TaxID=3418946 RepID=UPI003D8D8917